MGCRCGRVPPKREGDCCEQWMAEVERVQKQLDHLRRVRRAEFDEDRAKVAELTEHGLDPCCVSAVLATRRVPQVDLFPQG